METLIKALEALARALKIQSMSPTAQKIYDEAKKALGTSLVPVGDDPDLGCAISVSVLLHDKCGIDIAKTTGTWTLLQELLQSKYFQLVSDPQPADILMYATGTSTIQNTPIKHGHVAILGKYGVLSNNSLTGLWSENYSLASFKARYEVQGGYPLHAFRAK